MHYPVGINCWLLTVFCETFVCALYQDIFVVLSLLLTTQSRYLFGLTTFTRITYIFTYTYHPFHHTPFTYTAGKSVSLPANILQR